MLAINGDCRHFSPINIITKRGNDMATATKAKPAKAANTAPEIAFTLKTAALRNLFEMTREIADLWAIQGLLGWDQQTQMPPGANEVRSEQMATLEAIVHAKRSAPALGKAIAKAEAALEAHPERATVADRALVREARRMYDQATKLPEQFVRDFTVATATGYDIWHKAREANDFAAFAPILERIVELVRQR